MLLGILILACVLHLLYLNESRWLSLYVSINNFFPYCSNEVQLNKYSQNLAIAVTIAKPKKETYKNILKIMNLKRGVGIDHCYKK